MNEKSLVCSSFFHPIHLFVLNVTITVTVTGPLSLPHFITVLHLLHPERVRPQWVAAAFQQSYILWQLSMRAGKKQCVGELSWRYDEAAVKIKTGIMRGHILSNIQVFYAKIPSI